MSRRDKLKRRFITRPADFTYDEMSKLLKGFGYEETKTGKTAGSRVAFINNTSRHIIRLHRPHPGNVMKKYQIDLVEEALRAKGLIE